MLSRKPSLVLCSQYQSAVVKGKTRNLPTSDEEPNNDDATATRASKKQSIKRKIIRVYLVFKK